VHIILVRTKEEMRWADARRIVTCVTDPKTVRDSSSIDSPAVAVCSPYLLFSFSESPITISSIAHPYPTSRTQSRMFWSVLIHILPESFACADLHNSDHTRTENKQKRLKRA